MFTHVRLNVELSDTLVNVRVLLPPEDLITAVTLALQVFTTCVACG